VTSQVNGRKAGVVIRESDMGKLLLDVIVDCLALKPAEALPSITRLTDNLYLGPSSIVHDMNNKKGPRPPKLHLIR
jgi:hypothetical protein